MTDQLKQAAQQVVAAWGDPTGAPAMCRAIDAMRSALAAAPQAEPAYTLDDSSDRTAQRLAVAPQAEPVAWRRDKQAKLRKTLQHHGLTKHGDGVVEADILAIFEVAPQAEPVALRPEDVIVEVFVQRMGSFASFNTHGVRLTHKPTGLQSSCEAHRSQHKNRAVAWLELEGLVAAAMHTHPAPAADVVRDAERYRFIRDADRSDCISHEISLYAMESLDEYVDAAMQGEAAMKGAER